MRRPPARGNFNVQYGIHHPDADNDLAHPQDRRDHPQESPDRASDPIARLAHGLGVVDDSETVLVEGRGPNVRPARGPTLEQDEFQRIRVRVGVVRISAPVRLKDDAFRAPGAAPLGEMSDP
ncbi:MAG: hypothetical protein WBW81_01245 [Methylocella sp.]